MKALIKEQIGPLPQDGRTYFVSDGTWSLYELIDYLCDLVPASHVQLTSFSLSEDSIRHLLHLKESGRILSLKGLFDPSLRKTKTPLLYFAAEVFDHIGLTANHSKIVLFDNDSLPLVLIASANLGRNRRMETGVIETDNEVFAFYSRQLKEAFLNAQSL